MLIRPVLILTLATLLASCSEPRSVVNLRFAAVYHGEPLACGAMAGGATLTDLRFFVHAIELRSASGNWHTVTLDTDPPWQHEVLAMVDLEDGSAGCANGTAEMRDLITGHVPAGKYSALRFVLGVPFEQNHADPLAADSPLDDPAMHWHWRSGYKFLRAGVATADDGFWLHLGSTGCEGTVGNISVCSRPNRVPVEIDGFDPATYRVVLDLAGLAEGADLTDGVVSDCVSSPAETGCHAPFGALGLDFETGVITSAQRVFGALPP